MLKFKSFNPKETSRIIDFAVEGMDFQRYTKNPLLLRLYGYYFWYLELLNCTEFIAVYEGEDLMGVLLADMKDEPKAYSSFWKKLYVKTVDMVLNTVFSGGQDVYCQTNRKMFEKFKKTYTSDGEIRFLAVNPAAKGKGIGTLLLNELVRRQSGKRIHLYTDDGCTYQFYDKKGFERVGDEKIKMDFGSGEIDLNCFLYTKKLS